MIRLRGINFILSYQCNVRCAHCFFPNRSSSMALLEDLLSERA